VLLYRIKASRVERCWEFAQWHHLAMYRTRFTMAGHSHIQYVIEVPNCQINTRLLLEHSEYLELV
jgi:hypothetical protein